MITGTCGPESEGSQGSGVYLINPMLDFCGIMSGGQLETEAVRDDASETEVGGMLQ